MTNTETTFYKATGGTLDADVPSYITRQADTDLYQALLQGDYCYVLTSRQMGKSSLIVRVAQQLRAANIRVAVLELSKLASSNTTARVWYRSLLEIVSKQLGFKAEMVAFWKANDELDDLYRWMQALQQVVLSQCAEPVVICLDEIDSVLTLPFSTDEFFAGIRECFNARTQDPELHRLTFCLIGVATPSELIQDARITPFNIGRRIDLTDFTEAEAQPLVNGLQRDEKHGRKLLQRIFYWTNGQPYLTQKLCQAVAEDKSVTQSAGVDRVCEELFFESRSRESENNLQHVRTMMLPKDGDHAAILDLYRQVREGQEWRWQGLGKRIRDDDTNPLINTLRLAGLVRVWENYLWVRNRIYFRVFDKVWIEANLPDAEKRRQRAAYRRGLIRASARAVATVVMIALGGGIYYYWDSYVREVDTYCNTYTKRFGIMQCVGELTVNQGQSVSYKFIRKGRKNPAWKVLVVDGLKDKSMNYSEVKTPTTNFVGKFPPKRFTFCHNVGTHFKSAKVGWEVSPAQECEHQWEFVLDARGKIVKENAFNREGKLVWGLVYSPFSEGQLAKANYNIGEDGYSHPLSKSAAEFVEFSYSERGDETTVRYFDSKHQPQLGLDGTFIVRKKFDNLGLTVEEAYFNIDDKPMLNKNGYQKVIAKYDTQSNVIEGAYFGINGWPILHKEGWHKWIAQYDARGNRLKEAFFGTEGQPILLREGWHKWIAKYNARGNPIETAFFGTDGQPILDKNGVHKWTSQYDMLGNPIEIALFGTDGKPILHKDGIHKWTSQYDEQGNPIERVCFGTDGKAILHKDGYHKWTRQYDERGKRMEITHFGIDGQPILLKSGYHKLTVQYGVRANEVEWAFFGTNGQPILLKEGIHKWISQFDARNNEISKAFFGTDGKPILSNEGLHKWKSQFDARGNKTEQAYFGTDGKPILHKDGNHKWTSQYDARGNEIVRAFFDTDGQPILHKDGYHKRTSQFDARGNETEQAYFGTDGKPILFKDGYHKWTYQYDERGNATENAFFGIDGQPILLEDGWHKWTAQYDMWGNKIVTAIFGADGQPILYKGGWHKWTAQYDARGNVIEWAGFGLDGQPILHKDGYHKSTKKYDDRGNVIEWAGFGIDGKPVLDKSNGIHKLIKKYDDRGNLIEKAYFDALGNPTTTSDGLP